MKIIGICGKLGSGKDAFADYLVRKKGFQKIVMSDIIIEEMKSAGIKSDDIDRQKMQEFSRQTKEEHGADIWAKACVEYAKKNNIRRVVISGLRDTQELNFFRTLGDDFKLICIKANQETRFKRIKQRKSIKDTQIFADFIKQEVDESKIFDLLDKGEELADFLVDNNNMIVELYARAEEIIKELGW